MDHKAGSIVSPFVLYEDNHLIAVCKPPGMPSQEDESGDPSINGWVAAYIRDKYQKPGNVYVGLLHRLDRPAGGAMVFAKTSKAAERMSAMFQKRKIEKRYLAVTEGVPWPLSARLQHYLARLEGKKNIMRAHDTAGTGRQLATLEYSVLEQRNGAALVEVQLETGRKHQIRVQLAKIGCGIAGDAKYCQTRFLPDKSIALWAWKISFGHPVRKGGQVEIVAAPPLTDPWLQFDALGNGR